MFPISSSSEVVRSAKVGYIGRCGSRCSAFVRCGRRRFGHPLCRRVRVSCPLFPLFACRRVVGVMRLLPSAVVCFLSCFGGATRRRRCPFSLVRPPLWRRCSALCVRALSVAHPPVCAVLLCRLWRRGAPFFVPSQSREPQVSAFAPCERREVYGLPKHCFELNAPLSGAGFPVLECPSLFAPLALARCVRLARRVFPGCKEAFSASDRNPT